MFEGGIRVNAFVSGGFVPEKVRGTVQEGTIHVADWFAVSRLCVCGMHLCISLYPAHLL